MNQNSAQAVVENLLAFDANPPDVNYSPFDYGESVATNVCEPEAKQIVEQCLRLLPGTLATSFLEGFLGRYLPDSIDLILMHTIPEVQDLGSAGSIVELLRQSCGMEDQEIADRILDSMKDLNAGAAQDRLSFALWSVICGETYDVQNAVTRCNGDILVKNKLSSILENLSLTDYSRSTLKECMTRISK